MPEIQSPDPGRKLQERYNLTGGSPSPFLSPEIVPVTLVDDLTGFDVLEATFERPAFIWISHSGTVPNVPIIRFVNPTDSGVLAIVEKFTVSSSLGSVVTVQRFATTISGTSGARRWRDSRLSGQPICQFATATDLPAVILDMQFRMVAAANPSLQDFFLLPEVLSPGFMLDFRSGTANDVLDLAMWFRERTL